MRTRMRMSWSVLLLSLIGAAAYANPPAVTVAVVDLGTLGGSGSSGFGVNNKGQVAGTSQTAGDKAIHGFFYADGKMTDVGTLGGDQSGAYALNDAGQVTGNAELKPRDRRHHAFMWQQGRLREAGTSRADDSAGLAISAAGQVVGSIVRGGFGASRACRWVGGRVDTLEDAYGSYYGGGSECRAVNDRGQVAGSVRKPGRHRTEPFIITYYADHAALWQGHKTVRLRAEAEISLANAINDSGQIAGAVSVGPDMTLHACLWQNGKMTDLGTLAGQNTVLYGINRAGLMVGGTSPADLEENGTDFGGADQVQHAFCYSAGEIVDLNYLIDAASGWVLADARSISDTGYVTGTGLHNGQVRAYLLKLPAVF